MNRTRLLGVMVALCGLSMAAIAGCSESTSSGPDSGRVDSGAMETDSGTPGTDSGTPGTDSGMPGTDSGTTDGGAPMAGLVITEIDPAGEDENDYIELLNPGSTPIDLSDVRVTDDLVDLADAATFPAGTMLAGGARFVVRADLGTAMTGIVSGEANCLPGVSQCVHAAFGISRNGDTISVLAADGTTVITSAESPATSMSGLVEGTESWCRLPDATGELMRCARTPGAANAGI